MAEEEEESCRRSTGRPNLVDAAGAAGEKEEAETQSSSNRGVEAEMEARESFKMSGRPRTTSFAEGNKPPANPPLGGMKISSKYHNLTSPAASLSLSNRMNFTIESVLSVVSPLLSSNFNVCTYRMFLKCNKLQLRGIDEPALSTAGSF